MKKQLFEFVGKCFLAGIFLALMGFQQANAQQTITGTIVDELGQPIPGANIVIKGTTTGVVTDFDGNYSIEASPTDELVISYVGYTTQNIVVGSKTTINVNMELDQQLLDEVVVIGYGTAKKKDVTGAVARVSSESFANQPLTRVDEALQGRAAGVTVAKANGAPGAGIKVRIRGVNSITGNNDPLVVIDGVLGGDLSTLNPNDIASMDVLKDASATAIYGVRGSNGVILVSTKKGSGRGKINVDYFTAISQVPDLLPTLADNVGEFARIENIRKLSIGQNPTFTDAEIADLEANGGTNYQDEILRTAVSKNLQISASGSEGKLRYFLSGNYRDEEGIVINTGYQQLSLRSNLDAQISDKLRVGLNIFGTRGEKKNNFEALGNGQGSLMYKANTWDPTTPIYDANGLYNRRSLRGIASLNLNPVLTLNETQASDVDERFSATLNTTYQFTDNFSYTMVVGAQVNNYNVQRYAVEGADDTPDANFSTNKYTAYQLSNIFTWQKVFSEIHDLKLTGVQEYSNSKNISNNYNADNLLLPNGFYFAETASGFSIGNNFGERELSSFMLRAEYILDDNLSITATGRYDGTSVFRPGKKWGFFPSVAAGYSIINPRNNSGYINNLKLRAGWGQVGNQGVGTYGTYANLGNNIYAYTGGAPSPGTFITSFANEDLTWETTSQTNVGIDLGFNSGRGSFSVDGYKKVTSDLLLNVPVSGTNGGGNVNKNVGEVENFGFDVALGYDIIQTKNLNWNSNLAVSHVKNKVTQLFDGLEQIDGQYQAPGGQARVVNIIQLGEPLGQLNGATFLGTWKSSEASAAAAFGKKPGDAKYLRDENGEIVFGAIGNGTPTLTWGFNNTISYKNWDINIFLNGSHGFDIYNLMQAGITGGAGDSRSFMAADQVNQWTPSNETDIPATVQLFNSSRYIEKGDFVRLSNLNIGYTFKDFAGLSNTTLKLYVGGQNLFLITDYSGYDPELSSRRGDQGNEDVAPGINVGAYPNPRTYTLGVKVGF
ncbi:TonB-linked outer membrane protein, SusC/RagA family [Arenibacter palladensis]|uniref:TonB-linked outer membrane protein, SusC/RagA family n=1 Tax=Arenibacter palladensis TaxID=237373 RepID=A0A1M5EYY4_9FLAO|nr:TonB-dependent receptor [Arenibacter palladensis]SHF84485.1 TonB-linked outer membrane protein, SusC/RagA family [Arenibacter palladensis]